MAAVGRILILEPQPEIRELVGHVARRLGHETVTEVPARLDSIDAVVIATDHSGYDYAAIVDAAKLVIDTRNATRRQLRHRNKIVLC